MTSKEEKAVDIAFKAADKFAVRVCAADKTARYSAIVGAHFAGYKSGYARAEGDIIKRGFIKTGTTTYRLEELEYPHDERCEGVMCNCGNRAQRENPEYRAKREAIRNAYAIGNTPTGRDKQPEKECPHHDPAAYKGCKLRKEGGKT